MAFGIEWLKPELDEPKYYVHIVIVVVVALTVLKYFFMHDILNIEMIWKVSLAMIFGDTIAHTSLKLD